MMHNETIYDQRTDATGGTALCAAGQQDGQPRDAFAATLAHELRTPLTAILNSLQVMHQCGADEPPARQARDIVERQARHMTRVIDDVLDICRSDHGKLSVRRERVNLAAVVASAIEAAAPLITARSHNLTVTLPPNPPALLADSSRLEQILVNLLTNAAKYTQAGGNIWLTCEPTPESVVLRVRDTGIGISPEMLPHIFDLFAQSNQTPSQSSGGLGIGLALVRRLVGGLDGSVNAFSAGAGQGSEFVVRLPRIT